LKGKCHIGGLVVSGRKILKLVLAIVWAEFVKVTHGLVNLGMNFRFPYKTGILLFRWSDCHLLKKYFTPWYPLPKEKNKAHCFYVTYCKIFAALGTTC
jgi:hypothetical protein